MTTRIVAKQDTSAVLQALISNLTADHAKTALFWYVVYHQTVRIIRHVRARGIVGSLHGVDLELVKRVFKLVLLVPSARRKVEGELNKVTLELEAKLAPKHPSLPPVLALPSEGLSREAVSEALTALSALPNTQWEDGRVSGAVYHGGEEMGPVWAEAMSNFIVRCVL